MSDAYTLTQTAEEVQIALNNALNIDIPTDPVFFDIDFDGVVSLKPEYRGRSTDTAYPYSISDNGSGNDGSLIDELPEKIVFPEVINGMAVTGFQPGMFYNNLRVKEIVLPNTVTAIPANFCASATYVTTVRNTEHITSIGDGAFTKSRLEKAVFPNLKQAGENAFSICAFLRFADIGNNLTEIPVKMFNGCLKLFYVRGGANVTKVNEKGFFQTYALRNAPFLSNGKIAELGKQAFYKSRIQFDWTSLTGCTFGDLATPVIDNTTDYWSGCTFEPCENPLNTVMNQRNPLWANETFGTSGKKYSACCMILSIIHVHSATTGNAYATPEEFEAELASAGRTDLLALNPTSFSNAPTILSAIGYTTEALTGIINEASLQKVYDTLAEGGYILINESTSSNVNAGHTVTLYGINSIGEVLVADSDTGCHVVSSYDDLEMLLRQTPFQNMTGPDSDILIVKKAV